MVQQQIPLQLPRLDLLMVHLLPQRHYLLVLERDIMVVR